MKWRKVPVGLLIACIGFGITLACVLPSPFLVVLEGLLIIAMGWYCFCRR